MKNNIGEEMNTGIYCIINTKNGGKYVGSSTNIKKRWVEHKRTLRNGCHINPHLQAAWDKYGEENFEFRVIAYTDPNEAVLLEDYLLKNHFDMFEYNIARDAVAPMRGLEFSEERRRKISEAHIGKTHSEETRHKIAESQMGESNHMYGKRHSDETIRRMREAKKGENHPLFGEHHTEETKRKIAESERGENNHNFGKPMSEEQKRKISESQKRRWASQRESE